MAEGGREFDDQGITLELTCPECEGVMFVDCDDEWRVVQCPHCGLVFDYEPGEGEDN